MIETQNVVQKPEIEGSKKPRSKLSKGYAAILQCPRCGYALSDLFMSKLSELTGISMEKFHNGEAQKEISFKMKLAEVTLTKVGMDINKQRISRISAQETIKQVDRLLTPRLSEKERQRYEEKLQAERERRMKVENQRNDLLQRMSNVPSLKGAEQEFVLIKQLEAVSRYTDDEFVLNETNDGEDILCKIIEDDKIVDQVLVESKKVKRWSSKFLDQLRGELRSKNSSHGILATTIMPHNALNKHLYITKDGLWVCSPEASVVAYRALRAFIVSVHKAQLNQQQVRQAIDIFQQKIMSEEYLGKLQLVAEAAKKIAKVAATIRKSTNRNCSTLEKQADIIHNQIGDLESLHNEIILKVRRLDEEE